MNVEFNNLLVYSESRNKYFFTEFVKDVNIITGKNTAGKSTLIQSILYSLGINDGRAQLSEILDYDVLFRLDLTIADKTGRKEYSFIREAATLIIAENGGKAKRFDGINADNSFEHIKLKSFVSSLFQFDLTLETKGELKKAPIECILLPYYISQSVGWVYLRDSFSSLGFYKNFKQDYLDYYLGITSTIDRLERQRLTESKLKIEKEITFLEAVEAEDEDLKLSKLVDEEFKERTTKYIEKYALLRKDLVGVEEEHIRQCNLKSMATNRLTVLKRTKRNMNRQKPKIHKCPVCVQTLPNSLEAVYEHEQDLNDTQLQFQEVKERISGIQSKINSAEKKILKLNRLIETDYALIKNYSSSKLTFDTWLGHKSNVKLIRNIDESIGRKTKELNNVVRDLKALGDESDLDSLRNNKEYLFGKIFRKNLSSLGVPLMDEPRYTDLYSISSFPYQGVELHKTVMAYHFSLNELIATNKEAHRFPFTLDAVMKEDIDPESRSKIFNFIDTARPKDTQTLFSVSESMKHSESSDGDGTIYNVELINEKYFEGKAKIIRIGDGNSERAFLSNYNGEYEEYIASTLDHIYRP